MASNKADTYGWDTVFGIRIDDVNAAIESARSSPSSFQVTGTDALSDVKFALSGSFSDWRITRGGSGKLLHMSAPVTHMDIKSSEAELSFSDGEFVIEVRLHYLPHTSQPEGSTGTFHDLKVKHSSDDSDNEPVVTIVSSHFPQDNYGQFQIDVESAMRDWFNSHLQDLTHTFATVNLNRTADNGQFKWLLPTYTSYAYIDGTTDDNSILGILCMTDDRSADGKVEELSPNVIPEGSRAGFLISAERFLSQMVLPSMGIVFKGSSASDYELSTDNKSITLRNNNPVKIDDVIHKGKAYALTLKALTIATTDERLTIDATTMVEPSWEIYSYSHNVSSYEIVLHTLKNGKQTIFYQVPPPPYCPTEEHWTEKGAGVEITEIIQKIIAALLILAIGVATDGAGLVAAALIIGILSGVASVIPNIISAANTDDAPPIDFLQFNCIDPIQWTDRNNFTLTRVALNESLQLGIVSAGGSIFPIGDVEPRRFERSFTTSVARIRP